MKGTLARILLAGFLFVLPKVHAAQMFPLSISNLTQKADLIVQGVVQDETCQRDPEGRIYTKVNTLVSDVWKGRLPANSPTNALAIVHSGGTVGDVRAEVSDGVTYQPGEEFVAFLRFNQHGNLVTIGLMQGKFRVWQDRRTGEKFAHNIFHGASEAEAAAGRPALRLADLKAAARQAKP